MYNHAYQSSIKDLTIYMSRKYCYLLCMTVCFLNVGLISFNFNFRLVRLNSRLSFQFRFMFKFRVGDEFRLFVLVLLQL